MECKAHIFQLSVPTLHATDDIKNISDKLRNTVRSFGELSVALVHLKDVIVRRISKYPYTPCLLNVALL